MTKACVTPKIEPLLLSLPTELLGAKVQLHAYRDSDASELQACVMASRAHLAAWMPWVKNWDDPLQGEKYVREMQAA